MSESVDVLAVMDRAAGRLAEAKALTQGGFAVEMTEARAAVAELIAADRELQFIRMNGCAAGSYDSAVARHDAALARVREVQP